MTTPALLAAIFTFLSGLLTPIIAVIAVWIAYQQWRTAHLRLKFNPFEKRLAIHTAARDLIADIAPTGQVNPVRLIDFVYGTRQARWLLSEDIQHYFDDEFYQKVLRLQRLIGEEPALTGNDLQVNFNQQLEIKDWILNQQKVLDSKFDEFLKIRPYQIARNKKSR